MQSRFGIFELQLDPSPPIPLHGLVGRNLAAKMFDVERSGAILVEYRKFGELDVHDALLIGKGLTFVIVLNRPVLQLR
jgi:hypothetical protein